MKDEPKDKQEENEESDKTEDTSTYQWFKFKDGSKTKVNESEVLT